MASSKGNGWSKPKIHEQLHILGDIKWNGMLQESHSESVEHNHLEVKSHSQCTQQKWETLDFQLGTCISKMYIINYCFDQMNATRNNHSIATPA